LLESVESCPEAEDKTAGFFNLMERVGDMGKYQVSVFVLWCLVVYMAGGLTLMIPYLFYQDPYFCGEGIPESTCRDTVCSYP
jgi:hypothetical protein